ncbi:DoxX family protein [Nocardia sp. AG03]|uniref:DoxX family protein n=1 Tax=Nocardia sp. AG03 TaxID=3025312 RepID=UPI002418BA9A|nr:DoxX family protein [Nocardia sp. AG03]
MRHPLTFLAYVIIAAVLSAVLLVSAGAKFTRPKRLVDQMSTLALPFRMLPFLGAVQIAGAVGLVAGVWWGPLGVAAAVGVTLYFLGAVATHLRVGDFAGIPPAAVLAGVAVVTGGLRAATL